MPYQRPETPGIAQLLRQFGAELRRCRHHAGWSQMQLAEDSGVSQSTISRLERGIAPMAAMVKLVLISAALGDGFPLGFCPHDHDCAWERLDESGSRLASRPRFDPVAYFAAMRPDLHDRRPDPQDDRPRSQEEDEDEEDEEDEEDFPPW